MRGRADDAGPSDPDDVRGPSELVESILLLLEEAGAPTDVNDAVVSLIEKWEWSREAREADDQLGQIYDIPGEPE